MNQTYSLNWDLDVFFPGGSQSPQFQKYVQKLEQDVQCFDQQVKTFPQKEAEDLDTWHSLFLTLQDLFKRLTESSSFVSCLEAADMKDEAPKIIRGRLEQISASLGSTLTLLDDQLLKLSEDFFKTLLQDSRFQPIAFSLKERRDRAKEKMDPGLESLAGDLSVDGYHAWGELYYLIVGRMSIPYEEKGEVKQLSVGQASNKMTSGNRAVRKEIFNKLNDAWEQEESLLLSTLNHLSGYRLQLYRHRKWDSVLKEPLALNRMSEKTLQTMWKVIDENEQPLLSYFQRKASMLGVDKLSWYDVYAPLSEEEQTLSYDEAANFILEHFGRFDSRLQEFALRAFQERWIEAEDRPGKRPGGFCTSFGESNQSRIFMTFSGSATNVSTLAHELGHAYHSYVMKDLPPMAKNYAMNVAETASTFAELIVADASIRTAKSKEQKIALLEDKIQRSAAFFMDVHARFLFESRFYEQRKQGPVSAEQVKKLILEAQREAFHDGLDEYHPYFWAAKLHFFITGMPFYNFPYTFGYLFSTGLYGKALTEGPQFAEKYVDLLRDTGRMSVEELANKHLGVDLTQPTFWQDAVDLVHDDIRQFLALTAK